jgi:hypothetical protein
MRVGGTGACCGAGVCTVLANDQVEALVAEIYLPPLAEGVARPVQPASGLIAGQ